MKLIKSYQLFLENKSQLESVVTQFLIYNERKLGLHFDRFDIINSESGKIRYITAFTKEGPKGEIPNVDKIVFDVFSFQIWILEKDYNITGYNSDTSWRSPKSIEESILSMKTNVLRDILIPEHKKVHDEPSEDDKNLLDKAFNFGNVWGLSKDKVIEIIHILNKYDIEDIEDRIVEFTDEIPGWKPKMMFAYYRKNSWNGIGDIHKVNIDDMTCKFIWDAWYSSKSDEVSLNNFIKSISPCLFVQLNYDSSNYEEKNLNIIEEIADRIVIRFKSLYDIDDVILPYSRKERRYDSKVSKISDYDMTFILK